MSSHKKRKAISYVRMSTDQQLKGHSLKRQTEATLKYAEANNLHLIENLQDIGLSAYKGHNLSTGKLGLFISDLRAGKIEKGLVLIVESLDRISREKPTKSFALFSEILNHGVEIHTLINNKILTSDSVNNNPGDLFMTLGSLMTAYEESNKKASRGKSNWDKKRQDAKNSKKPLTKQSPGWLDIQETNHNSFKFVLNREAKAIKKIFEMCINNDLGSYAITKFLNQNIDTYPREKNNENKFWGMSYVKKILSNPSAYGALVLRHSDNIADNEIVADYFPAVISESEYTIAQLKIKGRTNKQGRHGSSFPNLFQNVLICGYCKAPLKFLNKGTKEKSLLRCFNAIESRGCKAPSWVYKDFEQSFLKVVKEIPIQDAFKDPEKLNQEKNKILEELAPKLVLQENNSLEISKFKQALTKIPDDILDDFIKDFRSLKDEQSKLVAEIQHLESQLIQNDNETENSKKIQYKLVEAIDSFTNSSNKSDSEIKTLRQNLNRIILEFVKRIEVFNNDVIYPWEIDFSDPEIVALYRKNTSKRSKYKTISEYYSSTTGQRELMKHKRYYYVFLKSGKTKIVKDSTLQASDFKTPRQL